MINIGVKHGSLTRAGKVRKQTPKVEKKERTSRLKTGRAKRRVKYNKRFSNIVLGKKKVGLNPQKMAEKKK